MGIYFADRKQGKDDNNGNFIKVSISVSAALFCVCVEEKTTRHA